MLNFLRRLVVPSVPLVIVGGLWGLQLANNECDAPMPNSAVDPALVQRALRAAHLNNAERVSDAAVLDHTPPRG